MTTYYRKTNGEGVQVEDTRICVVMVGLPARGKSLIAQKGTEARQQHLSLQAEANRSLMTSRPVPCLAVHICKSVQRGLLS